MSFRTHKSFVSLQNTTLFAFKSERKSRKKMQPCVEADIEDCTHFHILFQYKKYSRHFITVRLNHWWQMEYPGDAFHTFLGLGSVIYLAVNGTVTSLPVFIQNILISAPKTNKSFMGSE